MNEDSRYDWMDRRPRKGFGLTFWILLNLALLVGTFLSLWLLVTLIFSL